ncbi:MAG: TonB family protein, partial [Myxococcota bacterium]|nr:TonB family protein [Myxococcota bacterium]
VDDILEVHLIRDEPETARPAPMALAERALPNFAPQVQAVAPQIVNPHIISDASPVVRAEALEMDAVATIRAPTEISRSSAPVVERVSAVHSPIQARASTVDIRGVGGPAVRGPIKIAAPAGPSVGPRQVTTTSANRSFGTGKLDVGGTGSSVREGRITGRDVVGTPTGAPVVNINTTVGDGLLGGAGGDGTGRGASGITNRQCMGKPEVMRYLSGVEEKTYDRWILPPGVDPDQEVTLRFRLDHTGSAIDVSLVDASSNALGASAVDAVRSAAPFPPMPDGVRCLAHMPIVATFTNPLAG